MSNMTDASWPNLNRPGYHWLKCKTEENPELEIFRYDPDTEMFSGIGDIGCIDEVCFADHWEYHGPCPNPAQMAEMLAAERKKCANLVKQEVTNLVGDKRQFLKKAYLRVVLKSILQEIRNIGGGS